MQSMKQHQCNAFDSSSSLKLPLNPNNSSAKSLNLSRSQPVWTGAELHGGQLSPMHLDCCLGNKQSVNVDNQIVNHLDTKADSSSLLLKNVKTDSMSARSNSRDQGDSRRSVSGAGGVDHEAVIGSWPPLPPKGIRKKAAETLGFSAVAMEMLREQEDRDLHPFGRGGRFEGVLYSRRVKVQVDHTKFLAWIVFASFILLTSGAIIFLAEMERRQKSQQLPASKTSVTINGLLNANNGTV